MANAARSDGSLASRFSLMLVLGLLSGILNSAGADIGVCYGLLGSNLPQPQEVIALFNQYNIKRMRIYEPNKAVLQALQDTNIELMVGLNELQEMAQDESRAAAWVRENILSYSSVNFRYIVVGNEVKPTDGNDAQYLVPAMINVQKAIDDAGLRDKIKVSTAVDGHVIVNSYPPSKGTFNPEYKPIIDPLIGFLKDNNSPLLYNMYPYFSRTNDPNSISLDYALFTSSEVVVRDPETGLAYWNLFDAMLDAAYSALEKVGANSLEIVVSETGWPSDGGGPDTNIEIARTYNQNLIWHVGKNGTPKRPNSLIKAYVFAMFDEDQKPGDETEKHWGLFHPNKQPKYPISFG